MPLLIRADQPTIALAAQRLAGTRADLDHLSRYSYCDMPFPSESMMRSILAAAGTWTIVTENGPVGFILFPTPIAQHPKSFGMGVARSFVGKGYAKAALKEFISRCPEFGINELNGYCRNDNAAMLRVLHACGFQQTIGYQDRADPRALKFMHPLR